MATRQQRKLERRLHACKLRHLATLVAVDSPPGLNHPDAAVELPTGNVARPFAVPLAAVGAGDHDARGADHFHQALP